MRTFMDVHDDSTRLGKEIRLMPQSAKDAKAAEFNIEEVDWDPRSDGNVVCLLVAPDADAVRSYHAALGIPCGDVTEVSGLV